MVYKNNKPYQAIFLSTTKQASFEQPNHLTFAKEFVFDIKTRDIIAKEQVTSTVWPYEDMNRDEQSAINLNTDELFIEDKTGTIIANKEENKVKLSYEDTDGKSNQAVLIRDKEDKKPEKIIFKGEADVTQLDKRLLSEEVVFKFAEKKLISNTTTKVRPKTLIFKK